MLILDLDDTIFKTNSMKAEIFEPAVLLIQGYFEKEYGEEKASEVIEELWKFPFDSIAQKYHIPQNIQIDFFKTLDEIDYQLNISTFEDYPQLKQLKKRKILVTTGFKKLQQAKIKALKIEGDFEAIFIDDPREKDRAFKKGIFEKILAKEKLQPEEVWVIGDNPDSELKAGKALGMNTIQRLKRKDSKAKNADYTIETFKELEMIIK